MSEGLAWNWRLLDLFSRSSNCLAEKPPSRIVRLGLAAGALEGLIVGAVHGGIPCVILCVLWGLAVGSSIAILAWRVRRHTRTLVFSLLMGVVIEALGGLLIAAYAPLFAFLFAIVPPWKVAGLIIAGLLIAVPVCVLAIWLIYREILAAFRGLRAGAVIGAVALTIVGGMIGAREFGTAWAVAIGCIIGGVGGIFYGAIAGWIIGTLGGTLINTTRRTFLPTYVGLAGAIVFGFAGWFIGGNIAGDDGAAMGVLLGVPWGAVAGIAFGAFLTPRSWRGLSIINNTDPFCPVTFDMSDGRLLADLANTDHQTLLIMLVIGQIALGTRKLCLEPEEDEYRIALECPDSTLDPHSPISLDMGQKVITALRKIAKLDTAANSESVRRQEGGIRVMVSSDRVDLHMIFEPTPWGERVTITFQSDAGAADAAARVCVRFLFVLKARRWLFPHRSPIRRFLRESA
jgi:hypothetical protein